MKIKIQSTFEKSFYFIKANVGDSIRDALNEKFNNLFNFKILISEPSSKYILNEGDDYKIRRDSTITVFTYPKGGDIDSTAQIVAFAVLAAATGGASFGLTSTFGIHLARAAVLTVGGSLINSIFKSERNGIDVRESGFGVLTRENNLFPLGKVPKFYGEGTAYPVQISQTQVYGNVDTDKGPAGEYYSNYYSLGPGSLHISSALLNEVNKKSSDFIVFSSKETGDYGNKNDGSSNSESEKFFHQTEVFSNSQENQTIPSGYIVYTQNIDLVNTKDDFSHLVIVLKDNYANSSNELNPTLYDTKQDLIDAMDQGTSFYIRSKPESVGGVTSTKYYRADNGFSIRFKLFLKNGSDYILMSRNQLGNVSTVKKLYSDGNTIEKPSTVSDPISGSDSSSYPGEFLIHTHQFHSTDFNFDTGKNTTNIIAERITIGVVKISIPYSYFNYVNSTKPGARPVDVRDIRVSFSTGHKSKFTASNIYFEKDGAINPTNDNAVGVFTPKNSYSSRKTLSVEVKNKIQVPNNIPINYSNPFPSAVNYSPCDFSQNQHKNPAWICLDMLIQATENKKIDLKFNSGSKIDFVSFKKWADFCSSKSLFYSFWFKDQLNLQDSLATVAQVGLCNIVMKHGKITAVYDWSKDTVKNIISPSNSRDWNFTLTQDKKYHGISVNYILNKNTPQLKTVYSYFDGFDELNAHNFISYDFQIYMEEDVAQFLANFYRNSLKYRKEIMTCEMEIEGALTYSVGDLVAVGGNDVVNPSVFSSRAGLIEENGEVLSVQLKNGVPLDLDKTYSVKIRKLDGSIINVSEEFSVRADVNNVSYDKLSIDEDNIVANGSYILVNPILLDTRIIISSQTSSEIEEDDIILLCEIGADLKKYVVSNVENKEDLTAKITLLEYSSEVYEGL